MPRHPMVLARMLRALLLELLGPYGDVDAQRAGIRAALEEHRHG